MADKLPQLEGAGQVPMLDLAPRKLHHIAMGWCDVAQKYARLGSPGKAGEAFATAARWEQRAVLLLSRVRKRTMQPTLGILTASLAFLWNSAGRFYAGRAVAMRGLRQKNLDGHARQRLTEALEQARACIKWENRVDRSHQKPGGLPMECHCRSGVQQ